VKLGIGLFRRFGKADRKTGRKYLRRIVTWCMTCQKRRIENSPKEAS